MHKPVPKPEEEAQQLLERVEEERPVVDVVERPDDKEVEDAIHFCPHESFLRDPMFPGAVVEDGLLPLCEFEWVYVCDCIHYEENVKIAAFMPPNTPLAAPSPYPVAKRLLNNRFIPPVQELLRGRRLNVEDSEVRIVVETLLYAVRAGGCLTDSLSEM